MTILIFFPNGIHIFFGYGNVNISYSKLIDVQNLKKK